jgi:hypothetical protein
MKLARNHAIPLLMCVIVEDLVLGITAMQAKTANAWLPSSHADTEMAEMSKTRQPLKPDERVERHCQLCQYFGEQT